MATDYTADANIVSWWYFEEASSPRYDGSANDNDLSDGSNGGPARSATHIQGSYAIDVERTDNLCLIRADGDLAPSTFPGKGTTGGQGSVSAVAWIRLESTGDSGGIIMKGSVEEGESLSWGLYYDGTHLKAVISNSGWNEDASVTGATTLSINTWYHVAIVYTGSALQLWLGTESGASAQDNTAASSSISLRRSTVELMVGAKRPNGYYGFDGLIDEVAVFADALTESEINSIRAYRLDGSADAAASSTPILRRRLNILLRLCLSMFNLIWRCFK